MLRRNTPLLSIKEVATILSALEAESRHRCLLQYNHIQVYQHGHGILPSRFSIPVLRPIHLRQFHPIREQIEG